MELPENELVELEQGKAHLTLRDVREVIRGGDFMKFTMRFENAGRGEPHPAAGPRREAMSRPISSPRGEVCRKGMHCVPMDTRVDRQSRPVLRMRAVSAVLGIALATGLTTAASAAAAVPATRVVTQAVAGQSSSISSPADADHCILTVMIPLCLGGAV
ncbi:hypothetical protein ABZ078_15260 [Streptomyces sp. NPDC006385]|uniref:hypothetical protein n=1 Tax=Streptomyces sp. NPDC006385 TaxID=3156761 RepID=UPI0033ABA043